MTKKLANPKTRKSSAPVPEPQEPDDDEGLNDLKHSDELSRMTDWLYGLEAAILGVCDGDLPFHHGLNCLAADIATAMEACADAFEAERKPRLSKP
jgi:hypothetical protein